MSDTTKKTKKPTEKWRMVVMDDETFKEKLSFRLAKNKLIIWGSTALVLLFILFFLFIAFTPIKRMIPGYASIENNMYVIRMKEYVDDLEKQIDMQEKYNATLRQLLVGQEDSIMMDGIVDPVSEQRSSGKPGNYDEIYTANRSIRQNQSKRSPGNYYFIPPLDGKVNNHIDFEKGHYGVDIAGTANAPIKAIMEGIVVFADYTTETGYTIAIQHPNDMLSVYKHNNKLLKDIGNFVANGEAIAIIGNTGTLTDGPHLHFELWYKSTPLNPDDYILFE
jgi:murein DD-endopeptidase MepM/ murein hydrolase activator NlpD